MLGYLIHNQSSLLLYINSSVKMCMSNEHIGAWCLKFAQYMFLQCLNYISKIPLFGKNIDNHNRIKIEIRRILMMQISISYLILVYNFNEVDHLLHFNPCMAG